VEFFVLLRHLSTADEAARLVWFGGELFVRVAGFFKEKRRHAKTVLFVDRDHISASWSVASDCVPGVFSEVDLRFTNDKPAYVMT